MSLRYKEVKIFILPRGRSFLGSWCSSHTPTRRWAGGKANGRGLVDLKLVNHFLEMLRGLEGSAGVGLPLGSPETNTCRMYDNPYVFQSVQAFCFKSARMFELASNRTFGYTN